MLVPWDASFPTEVFTVSAWIRLPQPPGQRAAIIARGEDDDSFNLSWQLYVGPAGELTAILADGRNGSGYDCIVPSSGGKDSGFVAHQLKHRFGMHPLCVTWAPFDWTDIGWKNLRNFVASGFSNIIGQPDGILHRKLSRLAFDLVGDAWQPFTYGQKAWAFNLAEKRTRQV